MRRSEAEQERLRAAALLTGLTEREADRLLSLLHSDALALIDAPRFEEISVQASGQVPLSLRVWAGKQSRAGAVLIQFAVTGYMAYFAADRAADAEEIVVGAAETPFDAVADLFASTGRYAEAGVAPSLDAESLYGTLVLADVIAWQPTPYQILALHDRWQEALAGE